MKVEFNDKNDTYITDSLYQWDLNQVMEIHGMTASVAPVFHFSNRKISEAILVQSLMDDSGVITVNIPNQLTKDPLNIIAVASSYNNQKKTAIYRIEIPIRTRTMPEDYYLVSNVPIQTYESVEADIQRYYAKEKADRTSEDSALDARITAIASLTAGSTTGDAELIDARTFYNGYKFNSLGECTRQMQRDTNTVSTNLSTASGNIGDLTKLTTTDKTDLVSAVNEVNAKYVQPIEDTVKAWLDNHPEATTTVEDGSVNGKKLAKKERGLLLSTASGYSVYGTELFLKDVPSGYNPQSFCVLDNGMYVIGCVSSSSESNSYVFVFDPVSNTVKSELYGNYGHMNSMCCDDDGLVYSVRHTTAGIDVFNITTGLIAWLKSYSPYGYTYESIAYDGGHIYLRDNSRYYKADLTFTDVQLLCTYSFSGTGQGMAVKDGFAYFVSADKINTINIINLSSGECISRIKINSLATNGGAMLEVEDLNYKDGNLYYCCANPNQPVYNYTTDSRTKYGSSAHVGIIDMNGQESEYTNPATVKNIYVDYSNTSCIQDGTEEYPFSNIARAMYAVEHSDCRQYIVYVASGSYDILPINNTYGKTVYISGSGTVTVPDVMAVGADANLKNITITGTPSFKSERIFSGNARSCSISMHNCITDLNDFTCGGIAKYTNGGSVANKPTTATYGMVIAEKVDNYILQTCYAGANTTAPYTRRSLDGGSTWSAWKQYTLA